MALDKNGLTDQEKEAVAQLLVRTKKFTVETGSETS